MAEASDHNLFLYFKRYRSKVPSRYTIHLKFKNHQIIHWLRYPNYQSPMYRTSCQNRQQKEYLTPLKVISILFTLFYHWYRYKPSPKQSRQNLETLILQFSQFIDETILVSSKKFQTMFLDQMTIDWPTICPQSWNIATFDTLNLKLKDWSFVTVKL